jgi:hypothetical protein
MDSSSPSGQARRAGGAPEVGDALAGEQAFDVVVHQSPLVQVLDRGLGSARLQDPSAWLPDGNQPVTSRDRRASGRVDRRG